MRLKLFILLLTLSAFNCNKENIPNETTENPISDKNSIYQRSDLRTIIASGTPLKIVFGNENEYAHSFQEIADNLTRGSVFRRVESVPSTNLESEVYRSSIIELIGSPHANQWISPILQDIPISIQKDYISVGEKIIKGTELILKLNWIPNPQNPKLPLKLITAYEDKVIKDHLTNGFTSGNYLNHFNQADIEIFSKGKRLLFGSFAKNWTLDLSLIQSLEEENESSGSSKLLQYSGSIVTPIDERLEKWNTTTDQIEIFFGKELKEGIEVSIYSSAEKKALMTKMMDETHVDENILHSIHNEDYASSIPTLWIEQLIRNNNLVRNQDLIRPLAVYLNSYWNGKKIESFLYSSLATSYSAEKAFSSRTDEDSEYLYDVISSSYIAKAFSKDSTRMKLMLESNAIEYDWLNSLPNLKSHVSNSRKEKLQLPYLRGFNFAHMGYSIYNGYGSQSAKEQIYGMNQLYSNAVAIVPYTYMKSPFSTAKIPVMNGAHMENDESIIFSVRESQKLGMKAMVKPQIWLRNSWPGEIGFNTQEEWDLWLKEYREWIFHFAILAEISDAEIFCIGTEFHNVSLQKPDYWRKLIKDIREIYSGKLTYAANWGNEFENIEFWDDLDFAGCNSYYPLSIKEDPTDAELRQGAKEMILKIDNVSEKYSVPTILTEIGYPNLKSPWIKPYSEEGIADKTYGSQNRAIQAVVQELQNSTTSSIQGLFWWKWPSHSDLNHHRSISFILLDTPGSSSIKKYFYSQSIKE